MPLAFSFQRLGCGSLRPSTDKKEFGHADRLFKIPRSTAERYHADVWENRLPFPPKTKNNFSGIDISQALNAVNIPLCSLIFC